MAKKTYAAAITEPTKIFYDLLFDYNNLKYIFKYGFYWDDRLTGALLSKSSQRVRELVNIISEPVYGNSVSTPWSLHAPGSGKKSGRLLIKQNHYRLVQNRWFQDLCGCCGGFHDDLIRRHMENCGEGPYSLCRDEEGGSCTYRRLCMFREERETFLELLDGVEKKRLGFWKDNRIHREVLDCYGDVIEEKAGGSIGLKENTWREFFDDPAGGIKSGQKNAERDRFLDMIRFFSGFTPLSVLGGNFLKRLDCEPGPSYIMVRNLPGDFEFEQEYLYRCLYAMDQKMTVIREEEEYVPISLFYRDKGMAGVEEHLYLEAVSWADGRADPDHVRELPLFDGVHVRTGRKRNMEPTEPMGRRQQETRDFQVRFYYNSNTEYLKNRREEIWGTCIVPGSVRTLETEKIMRSPYDPDSEVWKTDLVTYRVNSCDILGFLLYIRSFGDFASMVSPAEPVDGHKTEPVRRQKGHIKEHESLLSVYNSDALMDEVRDRIRKGSGRLLPPRRTELGWLDFILREYPHFCSIFLEQESLDKIREKLREDFPGSSWFDGSRFDFRCRVKDLDRRVCSKYRRILDAMYQGRILQYEYKREQVRILPYALEYDVTRHLAGGSREPMDVMCYQLDEMRTVNIPYSRIETRTGIARAEYSFSRLEKLYHVLAYGIRCGTAGRQTIDERAERLLECMWKTDSRGGDNYNRCIRKKLKKPKDFLAEYRRFQQLCENQGREEEAAFFHKVFDYVKTVAGESRDEYAYEAFLLSCFTDGCSRLWQPRKGREVEEALDAVDDAWVWELLMGDPVDGVLSEIAFYNENLKNAVVSFVLRDDGEEAVERVYDVFRNFICAGEKTGDGRLRFTVSYEKFFYRKIHMALMALDDLVEELEPEEVARVICKRRENKREHT